MGTTALVMIAVGCAGSSRDPAARSIAARPTVGAPSAGCAARGVEGPGPTGRPERRTMIVDGVPRSYLVARPRMTARGTAPAPVVILFHGTGPDAEAFAEVTRLPGMGVASGTVVVAPDGLDHTWPLAADGADAAFVDAVLDDVGATTCVDRRRVVASGFSSGAIFATSYGCRRPGRISGIVTVAAEILPPDCSHPMPIVAFHGTLDPYIPYAAVPTPASREAGLGAEGTMAAWAASNSCDASPTVEMVRPEVRRHAWAHCSGRSEVVLYEIVGGGHTWPGSDAMKVPASVREQSGRTTQQIDASELALDLAARRHP